MPTTADRHAAACGRGPRSFVAGSAEPRSNPNRDLLESAAHPSTLEVARIDDDRTRLNLRQAARERWLNNLYLPRYSE
jgi:hypothetical protein